MPAILTLRKQEILVNAGQSLLQALLEVNIQPETILAIRDGEMITGDSLIRENDKIRLIHIISGGITKTYHS